MLGDSLDAERVVARYENGVLRVTVPVAEMAKARKVDVQVGEPALDVPATS